MREHRIARRRNSGKSCKKPEDKMEAENVAEAHVQKELKNAAEQRTVENTGGAGSSNDPSAAAE